MQQNPKPSQRTESPDTSLSTVKCLACFFNFCYQQLTKMGKEQSKLAKEGYVVSKKTESGITATKDDDTYFIKMIHLTEVRLQLYVH